ncbi:MAG: cellulase family glycosylhydrolase [Rhodobiaceae bacterium]|nr:cellulase family glycosylhydrolase [Rhodobiaceae bacterium]MCC0055244.1 cellulase family glycosylhydrolase [Rhodobiaceae bacterium]
MPIDQPGRIDRRRLIVGTGALAMAATLGQRTARAGEPASRIEIVGRHLQIGAQRLRLTGVAVGDPTYIRADRPLSDYRHLASDWRANVVRISVQPGLWRRDRTGVAAALSANVAAARAAGLFVIIDWHRIGFPGYYDPLVPEAWGLPTDANIAGIEETIGFWTEMAKIYGNDPAILFEIWNEPSIDARFWKATGEHWPVFKAAWVRIVTAIRAHAENIVLCAGGYWAHDLVGVRNDLVDDPRVAYVWHAYPNAERGDMAARLRTLGGLHEIRPVVVTEWGFSPETRGELHGTVKGFGEPFAREALEALGLNHTAWCYSVGAMPNLLASEDGRPSEAGAFVRALLRRSALRDDWRTAPDV